MTSMRLLAPPSELTEAVGATEIFLRLQQQLARVATASRPVLLIGERGTGKELAAARVHYLSPRWSGPLVKLNCAALAPAVLESELFGHEAGAFTGAVRRREGRFETAHGGTLFLDDLGLMPLAVQEKILRAIEHGTFERVGASEPVQVDVRLIAATNMDLEALVAAGRFKADLLDRLSFQVLYLPPLRLRTEDLELLANHFANRFAAELGLESTPRFTSAALAVLRRHRWPGNIRELKNVVERAVYLSEGRDIHEVVLNPFTPPFEIWLENGVTAPPPTAPALGEAPPPCVDSKCAFPVDFGAAIADREVQFLRSALMAARQQQRQAAKLLNLTYDQFRGLYRKHRHRLNAETVTDEPVSAAGPAGNRP